MNETRPPSLSRSQDFLVLIGYLPILDVLQIVNLSCDSYFPLPTIIRNQLGAKF
jgi:hypothetical protein